MKFSSRTVRLGIQLGLTFGFFLVELIVGLSINSLSLVSDAFHMLSDVLALVVAVYAIRVCRGVGCRVWHNDNDCGNSSPLLVFVYCVSNIKGRRLLRGILQST